MKSIIFSKDRACQLNALLSSRRACDTYNIFPDEDTTVIYKASDQRYDKGYNLIKKQFQDVQFIRESYFKSNLVSVLGNFEVYDRFICFFVDDIIFYRPIPFDTSWITAIFNELMLSCISLRLGQNTPHSYQGDITLEVPKFTNYGPFVYWLRAHHPVTSNFNYPASLDGHIFESKNVYDFVNSIPFNNPNELEANLAGEVAANMNPVMACPHHSVLVNLPINRVQDQYQNKYGEQHRYSEECLNDKFLDGYAIDYESMDFSFVCGCHQELELQWKKY